MDYKASNVDGHEYHRFSRVVVDVPLDATPQIICVEQSVLRLSNGMAPVIRDVGNLNFPFDIEACFPLLNPATGEPTGQTISGHEVYAAIWSVVMAKAKERDEAVEAARIAAEESVRAAEAQAKAEADARAAAEAEGNVVLNNNPA